MHTSRTSPLARSVSLLLAALLLVGTACSGGDNDDSDKDEGANQSESTTTTAVPEGTSWVAQVKADIHDVGIFADKSATEPDQTLQNPVPMEGAPNGQGPPLTFLIESDKQPEGEELIPVYLPMPPNGSTGYVKASDVNVAQNPFRIKVELGAHKLTLTKATDKGPETVIDAPVGVGTTGRETPKGIYFIKELLQAPDPAGAYGPFAYGLNGFSENPEVAAQFGTNGDVGLHGTNEPDTIGKDVSSGCLRVSNDVITQMKDLLPLGTPVEIIA